MCKKISKMKQIFIFWSMVLILWSCSASREAVKTSASLIQGSNDSTQYEIRVIDPHFDHWYLTNFSPAKDRTNDFYREKNLEAVGTWNNYFHNGRCLWLIDSPINYFPEIDYGIDVNRILYWYFLYIHDKYRIKLFQ
jgi:hypothetical protein